MLKRPSELNSQSNIQSYHTASDARRHRSLHSSCNLKTAWSLKSEVWSQEIENKSFLSDFGLQTPDYFLH
jgi:hypothetical protein